MGGCGGRVVVFEKYLSDSLFTPFLIIKEPIIDILDENGEIKVIAEMPGVEEQNIRVKVEGKKLSLSAEGPYRKYYRDEELDYPVESEFKTSYRNGILEVTLTKKEA